ncbi:hypothetical protein [Acanthopleuribacter pedis]|uniref:Uncharacterized protein n=1 Tax=Acanthopleuribacter pedis TaxID=442870 RepID=A0A8J7U7N8_9BACT|nr:hypothetical protein [Acanthopleuribacter pedis]MBO1321606.1 hypothetical protein [Acanthopleuribacter pedis]
MKFKKMIIGLILASVVAVAGLQADCIDVIQLLRDNGASDEVIIHFLKICLGK